MANEYQLLSLNIGLPKEVIYGGKVIHTGINKKQVKEPVYLSFVKFNGDGQADLVHHGGVDKAVCVYTGDHYPYWEKELNQDLVYGAFGENITVSGMREEDVCIGDMFELGEAIVQVTQPRQPCFKLAKKYNIPKLPLYFQETGYTGFYFRVLKEGWVSSVDTLKSLQSDPKGVSIAFANRIMHKEKQNIEGVKRILEVNALSSSWRKSFEKRISGEEINTKERLEGIKE
ncbi:MOSC domain-containing protein [Bacillus thuringiensis serovar kyushuensis]|uniref:MOSC domain-containing protein n=1 Tax=Bacillus cereus group TaxID=86661 RepID=UPI000B43D60C|nr:MULTISPECIES: MOSC domain-containing protein [Bacillus cereus group]MEC2864283.1 MOSC domain-containing protein [Bacillus cereus]OTZ64258.1 MOSC domain-containing protein [Bacillus thuringiensis serovar kyushuensis]OTZ73166.1 MOSC domain-containing protein [Bacillus thuringiensis serovar tohokuensis]OUB96453.1 MOSC domain-containing protein [Bacillus thuringiensis serovar indiana]HEQ3528744.1 MOSC domain-containing protein [Bacillus cereus]